MGTFAARYDSECPGCFDQIEAGDAIGYVNDLAVCGDCYDEEEEASRPKPAQPWRPEHSER